MDVSRGIIQVLGNYRLIAEIGSGGSGKVYQGQHIILTERIVAIKLLHSHLDSYEERERFVEEARILERLKHLHILHIYDAGIHEGFPYLVAEYAPGGSLRRRLKSYLPNPMPVEEALNILAQIGQGLHYAHRQNVIHRDLKPENILFNVQGQALLADFGIATTLSTESIKQVTAIGTPSYMAPEQFQGSVSKESDQYALGCIAYELFTGRPPFTAPDFFTMGFDHMNKNPIAPTQINPQLPSHIEQAILKAMAKQRADRYADIKAFILALHAPADTDSQLSLPTVSNTFISIAPECSIMYVPPAAPLHEDIPDYAQPIIANSTITPLPSHPEPGILPLLPRESATPLPSPGPISLSNPWAPTESRSPESALPPATRHMTISGLSLGKGRFINRKWLLIVITLLLIVLSMSSLFSFAFSPDPSPHDSEIRTEVPTHLPAHRPTHSPVPSTAPTPKPTAKSIHVPAAIPTPAPTRAVIPTPCHPNPRCHPGSHRNCPCH